MYQDYEWLLNAEIAAAEGDLTSARQLFELIVANSNLFQAHVGLARVCALDGDSERELSELKWIAEHKGQALVERSETMVGREINLLDWRDSVNRLNNKF